MKKLILIDGNSLINRAFYATPPLSNKDGIPTNAVYGFINMFLKMISDEKPEYIAVAFDVHHPTFRHEMFTEYKGTRKPMPEDLRPQIPLLKETLSSMGIYWVEKPGFEADDIIGTIAKATSVKTIIITGDRDSFQLVDEETEVHFTRRGISDVDILTVDNFKEKTGILPEQVIDLKALMGDASDNIPGVAGVGEKTALNLISTYQSIETLYESIEEIKGKLKEKLIDGKDSAFLSKTLATINIKVDTEVDLEKMTYKYPFNIDAKRKFFDLGFNKLLARAKFEDDDNGSILQPTVSSNLTIDNEKAQEVSLKTVENLNDINIDAFDKIAVNFDKNLSIFAGGNTEYLVKIKENLLDDGFELKEILPLLERIFSSNKKLIVFNKKALMHQLKGLSVNFTANADDIMIMKYLADYSGKEETLDEVLFAYGFDKKTPCFALYQMEKSLREKLVSEETLSLYQDVELPLIDVLFSMETAGFKVDEKALYTLSDEYRKMLKLLENDIHTLAGNSDFNVNSPKQLGTVLFDDLKLPYPKKKGKDASYSTAQEILEELSGDFPIIDKILKYRQIQKLVSTYIEGFKPLIEKGTGLIHTTFHQTVTATGRLSSKAPNLQNIPIRDEEGKIIRKFFVARDSEHILVGADYSQIELRLLASFSGCQSLIDAYKNGQDIHTETASRVFGLKPEEVTKTHRRDAKAVNFGIIYGISDFGLSKNIKSSVSMARDYIKRYFETYPEVKNYMDKNIELAKTQGYVTTVLNRRRYFKDINSSNRNLRAFAERQAMNMPLQGSSADIIKVAMVNVHNRLKNEGLKSKLILQVH
ncbi:MAG: DNA polymerase I, partial [Clostridia bacterium]|nr:DNA polymerase I [Clostridia bacterium]